MSGLRFVELREDTLDLVPKHFFPEGGAMSDCTRCLYWERPDLFGQVEGEPAEKIKTEWFKDVLADVDICGMVALRGHRTVAWARFAPVGKLPGLSAYSGIRPSPEAIFLACFAVSPSERGRGTGARFLRVVLSELAVRGWPTVETYARRSSANNPSGPLQLYVSAGFEAVGGEQDFPLLRLELQKWAAEHGEIATAGAGAKATPKPGAATATTVQPRSKSSGRHPTTPSGRQRSRSASGRQRSPV